MKFGYAQALMFAYFAYFPIITYIYVYYVYKTLISLILTFFKILNKFRLRR